MLYIPPILRSKYTLNCLILSIATKLDLETRAIYEKVGQLSSVGYPDLGRRFTIGLWDHGTIGL
jgi:hypothetical protein